MIDKNNIKLVSTCDDSYFMSGEIILNYKPNDGLNGVSMDFELQQRAPVYLRKSEIADLIENLQKIHDLIPNDR